MQILVMMMIAIQHKQGKWKLNVLKIIFLVMFSHVSGMLHPETSMLSFLSITTHENSLKIDVITKMECTIMSVHIKKTKYTKYHCSQH